MHRTYRLEISPAAKRDLKKVPGPVHNKIVFEHLPKIQDKPYSNSEPLIDRGVERRKVLSLW
jgi:mRNA-degrading endonuclease RelE of RelBE toxin-antitoxin system